MNFPCHLQSVFTSLLHVLVPGPARRAVLTAEVLHRAAPSELPWPADRAQAPPGACPHCLLIPGIPVPTRETGAGATLQLTGIAPGACSALTGSGSCLAAHQAPAPFSCPWPRAQ